MMNPALHQLALVKRELWEHKSIYVTPLAIALVMTLTLVTGYVLATGYEGALELGITVGQNVATQAHREAGIATFLVAFSGIFFFAAGVLTVFYCLDALYAERKNKSILFWRSLPITDAETVVSKLLTALLAIPLVTMAVLIVFHLIALLLSGLFVKVKGGSAFFLIWQSAPLFDVWFSLIIVALAVPIWFSPLIGWFLLVSAWTRRSPLLMGFLPLAVVPLLEVTIFKTHYVWDSIITRLAPLPLFKGEQFFDFFDEDKLAQNIHGTTLRDFIDLGGFLTAPATWAGIIVCALFITAAIYVRRYRDDS